MNEELKDFVDMTENEYLDERFGKKENEENVELKKLIGQTVIGVGKDCLKMSDGRWVYVDPVELEA